MSRRYAVVGHPVRHSKSPWIHAHFAECTQRDIVYAAYAPPLSGFDEFARNFFAAGGCGLNITVPFKQEALAFASSASAFSKRAQAANVLAARNSGIVAYNTDGAGLVRDITHNLRVAIADKRLLLIGAGGAARAVALALAEKNPANLCIAARNTKRAVALAETVGEHSTISVRGIALADCDEPFDIVINATSAALSGEKLPLSSAVFAGAELAYDLSYGKAAKTFLRVANQAICCVDGAGMLAEQAAFSFAIWEGVMPMTADVIRQVKGN
ncbi:shikimate dehydrogenase [Candidatus Persebacteraceae bacterium Df01]|jgi:shikimate dehydrogenase|uniref:Shikimate dehydrogenase (NADP(+)) n=1 Tax=Candidatus Doriopsillibacter californiensis TaxID=2970740 RepID=A0ABT7QKI1_9GAMM|nr:shikimate dehydrogenase [Candidatus Persebacteraceae bacterium Df01]